MSLPHRFIISVGSYDGVVAGWDSSKNPKLPQNLSPKSRETKNLSPTRDLPPTPSSTPLPLSFAISNHEGSVRVVSSNQTKTGKPGLMFSCGIDGALRLYDIELSVEIGETRLPSDVGTCTCGAWAGEKHILIGTADGKLILYEVSTLQVVHVMGGHTSPVSCITVHPGSKSTPPGSMALTCSENDNTVRLWDLTKGRCGFVTKIKKKGGGGPSIIKFSPNGETYTYTHNHTHITTKSTSTDDILLDIDLGQQLYRVNDVAYITESYICAGLNNGGISIFRVEADAASASEVRAAMVINGSESSRDTKNRIKRVESMAGGSGYLVVSCCSSGVVSVYDFEGAVNSLMDEDNESDGGESSGSDEFGEEDDQYVLLQQVKLGTGSRIVSISGWSSDHAIGENDLDFDVDQSSDAVTPDFAPRRKPPTDKEAEEQQPPSKKRRNAVDASNIMEDAQAVAKARDLIESAKKSAKKKKKKKGAAKKIKK
ncbi:hypothetical protein TrLO_g15132 [Triparma laevis f. longispina]|uniref:WD40 repeat-like protein n=1 Tax=Triparma laevis f. longispina TaxID=1714387 RepID=A0A9W7CA17_9STRA|nr:hypothetical protein TrLO_g15132 [Triparma laevis f. longispina]